MTAFSHSQWSRERARQRRALTILEVLVVCVLVSLLVALLVPALRSVRATARALQCAAKVRTVNTMLLQYTLDSRGTFMAMLSDRPEALASERALQRFVSQPLYMFHNDPWRSFSGWPRDDQRLQCPANQRLQGNPTAWNWTVDYHVSEATLFDPSFANPLLTFDQRRFRPSARVQRVDAVRFPSAKALLYESSAWHSWKGEFTPATDLRSLQWWGDPGPLNVGFVDGSVEELSKDRFGSYLVSAHPWFGSPFNTTFWGVFGRDR